MKRIALAVAGTAAVAGLAACSHTAASSTSSPSPQSVVHSTSLVDCIQQYNTWNDGNGKGVVAALGAISSADKSAGIQVLSTAVKNAKPAIARAARYPIPACADPKGYLDVLLMHVNAAVSANSVSALKADTEVVPEIYRDLTAELNRIAT
jgi:hypothetical protein